MLPALRPCPFCGGTDFYFDQLATEDSEAYHFVVCRDCWAEGPMCMDFPGTDDPRMMASQAWNGMLMDDPPKDRQSMPTKLAHTPQQKRTANAI